MRLEAQIKSGFYPAPPEALRDVFRLAVESARGRDDITVFDPCCGKGDALWTIGHEILGQPGSNLYGIEMDGDRSRLAALHKLNLLSDTDYLGSKVSKESMSLAWVNPPFDNELGGGGRVEYSFLTRATKTLVTGGIMALCCPERVAERYDVRQHFLTWYRDIGVFEFPEDCRNFNEVVVIGRKLSSPREAAKYSWYDEACVEPDQFEALPLPPAGGPKVFAKTNYTPAEFDRAMSESSLNRLLEPPAPKPMPRPPLQLSAGQRALVLAGGFLNVSLQKPGEPPILIKATPHKERFMKSRETTEDDRGKEKTVEIHSQRISLRVRVLTTEGDIHDLG